MLWLRWGRLCLIWKRQVLPSSIVVGHRHHSQHRKPLHRRKRSEDHGRGRLPRGPVLIGVAKKGRKLWNEKTAEENMEFDEASLEM